MELRLNKVSGRKSNRGSKSMRGGREGAIMHKNHWISQVKGK